MRPATSSCRGVTLIEMIVVIAILGIVAVLAGMFGRTQVEAYFGVANRTDLAEAADLALRRIDRDLQGALPNSVRVPDGVTLEFVPVLAGGRYRADLTPTGTGNPLDFTDPADTGFDVLGPPVDVAANQQLVIYNLGQPGSDVYEGTSRRALTSLGTGLASLAFGGGQFPFDSPQHRFQVVGGPATYQCAGGQLRRHWCYPYQAGGAQPTVFGALGAYPGCAAEGNAVLVDNVAACNITYVPGALARNGLVSIRLTLAANGDTVNLMHQVEILNSP